MNPIVRISSFRVHLACGAAIAAVLLAGCQTAAPPPPAPVAVYTPPPMGLPDRVVEAAAIYMAYMDTAAAITADFVDGRSVSDKVRVAAAYEAQQVQRGEAAYAAIAALQDPTFVAGVRAYAGDAAARQQIVNEIMREPSYVLGIKGAGSAAALAANALNDQGSRVKSAGEKVKQAAYDVQKQAWSKTTVVDRDQRLAEAKSLSAAPRRADPEMLGRLKLAAAGQGPMPTMGGAFAPAAASTPTAADVVSPDTVTPAGLSGPTPLAEPYTPLVVRGLAAAALAILGEGHEANSDHVWAVLEDPNQGLCLNMAKLNLYQCLSVAKPYYEDVFCLGQHILMDTGQCVIAGAGVQKAIPVVFAERTTAVSYGESRSPTPKKSSTPKKSGAKKKSG